MKKFLIINLFLILILTTIINPINAITVTDDFLVSNINELNSKLENKIDTTNPIYLTEIVDENGNVPAYEYYTEAPARSIKSLKAYDGKIFMGLGDWNINTGPTKVIYYDTTDGKIKSSGTINDEAIQSFNIIDDTLYTTGCDPIDPFGKGSYYTYNKEENNWEQHLKNGGWIHVFDIVKFKDKLYMCGSTQATSKNSNIQASSDNGETFESVPIYKDSTLLPYHDNLRCYKLVVYNNKLYGYLQYYNSAEHAQYKGIYEFDETNNCFNYIAPLPLGNSKYYDSTSFKDEIFNNTYIYIYSQNLYTSNDLKTFTAVPSKIDGFFKDTIVLGDTLYVLSAKKVTKDNNYIAKIYSTKDLSNFDLKYQFITDEEPFCMEYYDNIFYIGTIDDNPYFSDTIKSVSPQSRFSRKNGALYKIDISNAQRSLNINTDDKTISITDNGESFSVQYDLNTEKTTFTTTLNFNTEMTKEQWKQEYYKIRNLNLVFATIANGEDIEFDKSTSYFNNVFTENTPTYSISAKTAVGFAQEMFFNEFDIDDKLFTLTTKKISEDSTNYKTEVTLTINTNNNFNIMNSDDKDNTDNNTITNNTVTNNTINNNTINNNNNNNSLNNILNSIINNNNSNTNVNSEVEDYINNNNKLPQTGDFFEFKTLLQIIIITSILVLLSLIIEENKINKIGKKE